MLSRRQVLIGAGSAALVAGFAAQLRSRTVERGPALRSVGDEVYYESVVGRPDTLLVQCHSWSGDENEAIASPALRAVQDAAWVCPRLFGPNDDPNGAWSDNQRDHLKRVIDHAVSEYEPKRIVLVGVSGGAYLCWMALGTWPGLFHGASTWCGPHDLAAWWSESPNFRASLEACFGGTPAQKPAEYLARSPKGVLSNARDCVVYVNSGQLDTQIAPHHSADAAAQMTGLPGVDCRYVSYPSMGHAIDWPTAVVQIESMKAAVS